MLSLTACGMLGLGAEEAKPVVCPEFLILKDVSEIQAEKPAGSDKSDWQAQIIRLGGKCAETGDKVSMDLGIKIALTRGNDKINIPKNNNFFAAVFDRDQNIQSKIIRALIPEFQADSLNAVLIDVVELSLMKSGEPYTIYVGFEDQKRDSE